MADEEISDDREMFVAGLVLDPNSNSPIVILKDQKSDICLPIWIGLAEATAIASALKKVQVVRPMTHDLLKAVIDSLGAKVVRIVVSGLRENTFLASIEISLQDRVEIIDARPSDAIALAVRAEAPIVVVAEVLAQAQVTMVPVPSEDGTGEDLELVESKDGDPTRPTFTRINQEKWAEILAEMDPEDFKYKM